MNQPQTLISYLDDLGIKVTEEQAELCVKHLELVREKNKVMNLTRIVDMDEALILHLVDSLLLLPYLNQAPEGDLIDMGSGGGFPGVELAVCSGRTTVMVDSVGKKVNAINEFCDELGLQSAHAVHKRLEEVSKEEASHYACVTARALASMPVLMEYAAPYLKKDGLFIITKGNPSDEELQSGEKAAEICGLKLVSHKTAELPEGLGHREFFIYKKVSKPRVKLPRQVGVAKKNPLA